MEKYIYEAKPYIAFIFSIYALMFAPKTNFIIGCGMVLLFCALYLYKLRISNRTSLSPRRVPR
jgi:hypothetical protein